MPDAWETKAAAGPGSPAHTLNKNSPLDAEPSPLHFGYHPATPPERLPQVVKTELEGIYAFGRYLKARSSVYQPTSGLRGVPCAVLWGLAADGSK